MEWYERIHWELGTFKIGCDDMTLFSDSTIPESLKNDFKSGVAKLVASFNGNSDYHPSSDQAVVDLVHPSLFVVQHNLTLVVRNGILQMGG